jgi:release factor glutamine methyltransferase
MKAIKKMHDIAGKLTICGIDAADKEAELFMKEGLEIDLLKLFRDDPELNDDQMRIIEDMFNRRAGREPLQYILGYTDFMGLKIMVGSGVLIPRPETELMAEQAVELIRTSGVGRRASDDEQRSTILDLCTGSGCLALALAKNFPDSRVFGTDISGKAVGYARKNAELNGIENVQFFKGNLFEPIEEAQFFDLIISNPPYIRTTEIETLQPEIKEWEPLNALDGGEDGLGFYREIIPESRKHLKDNGTIMFELGDDCASAVAGMLDQAGFSGVTVNKDYSGIKRIIHARWIR